MLGWFNYSETPIVQLEDDVESSNFEYPDNVWYDEIDAMVYLTRYLCIKDAFIPDHEEEINSRELKTKIEYEDPKFLEYIQTNYACYEISTVRESLLEKVRFIIGCKNFPLTVEDTFIINSEDILIINKMTNNVVPIKNIVNDPSALQFISDEYYVFKILNNELVQVVKNNDHVNCEWSLAAHLDEEYKLSFEALSKHLNIKWSNDLEIRLHQITENTNNIDSLIKDELGIDENSNFYDYKYDAVNSIYNSLQDLYNRIIKLKSCIGNTQIQSRNIMSDEASALILSKNFILLSKYSNKIYNPLTLQQEQGSSEVCAEFYKSFNVVKLVRTTNNISKWEVHFSETNYVPYDEDDDVSDSESENDTHEKETDTSDFDHPDSICNTITAIFSDEYISIAIIIIVIASTFPMFINRR